ncbi:MAG TPA: transcriptional regulator [Propionibacteriaceae bacterium]|nr:transcriptional regulator [Propionibacteriaceae bacterium]
MESLAELSRQRRKALRLTQAQLAELAGVSERYVRLVEAGKVSVRLDKLQALLEVLGLRLRVELRSPS